jgi:cellulose synthase/poly-beta-1,6-N-acetylglucosamine synthase-like glycosyltransferase
MIELYILLFSFLIFGTRTLLFNIGSLRERRRKPSKKNYSIKPFVSVIVPARNEAKVIANCIHSIHRNNYPKDRFEIIAVNDRSSDATGAILGKLKYKYDNLKVINIDKNNRNRNLMGKPGALQAGIDNAQGSILMMTDADCTVGKSWIRSIVKEYRNPKVGFVAGFTYVKGRKFFQIIQAIEWVYMHALGLAGIGLNNPLGCFGTNISIRKEVYNRIGGFEKIQFSVTEDLALERAVFNSGDKVRYLCSPKTLVSTLPTNDLMEYINQHHRWAVGGLDLGWRGFFFVASSVIFWLGLLTSLVFFDFYTFLAVIGFRVFCDFTIISPTLNSLKKQRLNLWIIPAVLFFIILEVLVPFLLLEKEIIWKDQKFKRSKAK